MRSIGRLLERLLYLVHQNPYSQLRNGRKYQRKVFEELVHRIKVWDAEDGHKDPESGKPISKFEFRRKCGTNFYKVVNSYRLETITLPDGATSERLLHSNGRDENSGWTQVVYDEMVFDAIYECHTNATRHMVLSTTKKEAAKKYYNLTAGLCQIFMKTCPTCSMEEREAALAKPAPTAITFGDTYTACIVNYSSRPTTDPSGVEMTCILVLQDVATKFTVLRPIVEPEAHILAYELSYTFGLIGYPNVFVGEEGTELQSSLVRSIFPKSKHILLKYSRKDIDAIISVVKTIVEDLEQKERDKGSATTNWVQLIPLAMATINDSSHAQVCEVSRKINDLRQLESDIKEVDGGRFTIPEERLSDKARTDGHVDLEGVGFAVMPEEDVGEGEAIFGICCRVLICDECDKITAGICQRIVTIGHDGYYDRFETEKWWDADMVTTFGILKAHELHRDDVMVLDTAQLLPNEVSKMAKAIALPPQITTLLAVVKNEEHLVVLQIKLDHGFTVVYDGIKENSLDIWNNHDENIRGCFQIDQFKNKWEMRKSKDQDLPNYGKIKQTHPHDCGPIAGLVMWSLLDRRAGQSYVVQDEKSSRRRPPSKNLRDWRKNFIAELRLMVGRCVIRGEKCFYRLPKKPPSKKRPAPQMHSDDSDEEYTTTSS